MITEYEIKTITHPIIHEILSWENELWLCQKQLEQLFPECQSKIKRQLNTLGKTDYVHPHARTFSVVKQRKQANNDKKSDWVYQVRYYDLWLIKELLKTNESKQASAFLDWIHQTI